MGAQTGVVYVIDEDASVRQALCRLLDAAGLRSVACASAKALLDMPVLSDCACLIADVHASGTEGVRLPRLLAARGIQSPVIFLTAAASEQTRAKAKCSGAAGYFRKPVDAQALLDAIAWAMLREADRCRQGGKAEQA